MSKLSGQKLQMIVAFSVKLELAGYKNIHIPYTHQYNPRFVFIHPTFWGAIYLIKAHKILVLFTVIVSIQERVMTVQVRYSQLGAKSVKYFYERADFCHLIQLIFNICLV